MRERETGRDDRRDAARSTPPPEHCDEPIAKPSYPGHELLHGSSASQILARIAPGDPLGIAARCKARLDVRAQLIAHERAVARSLAQVAFGAVRYRGEPDLASWLDRQIDRALDGLINDDREDERARRPTDEPWDPRFAFVSEAWGVSPALARRACIAFNDLPSIVRQAWWALTVHGKSINRYVAEGFGPPQLVEARVKRAIVAMSKFADPGGDDPLDQPEDERG